MEILLRHYRILKTGMHIVVEVDIDDSILVLQGLKAIVVVIVFQAILGMKRRYAQKGHIKGSRK